jgi:hypothetical protein
MPAPTKPSGKIVAAIGATKESARCQIDAVGPTDCLAVPAPGEVLTWDGAQWVPGPGAGGAGITELDQDVLAGPGIGKQSATVVALQGNSVSVAAPANGEALIWNGVASEWQPTALPADTGITQLTQDVIAGPGSGSQIATVEGIQTRPVTAAAPAVGDLLYWDGSIWTYYAVGDITNATRVIHTPGVTPTSATFVPGLAPDVVKYGTTVALHYKKDADKVYGYAKIPTTYVSDASFHIHWTKFNNANESGRTVRWVINYTVFDGASQNVAVAPTGTLNLNDTYDGASADTTRIVYRTPNAAAAGFVAGYYVSFEVGFDPAFTTLTDRPVIISCDILTRQTINLGA